MDINDIDTVVIKDRKTSFDVGMRGVRTLINNKVFFVFTGRTYVSKKPIQWVISAIKSGSVKPHFDLDKFKRLAWTNNTSQQQK